MRALIVLLAVAMLGGCATFMPNIDPGYVSEQRTANWSAFCSEIGQGKGTAEYPACMLARASRPRSTASTSSGTSAAETRRIIRQENNRSMILTPGCTPNFVTGRCM